MLASKQESLFSNIENHTIPMTMIAKSISVMIISHGFIP